MQEGHQLFVARSSGPVVGQAVEEKFGAGVEQQVKYDRTETSGQADQDVEQQQNAGVFFSLLDQTGVLFAGVHAQAYCSQTRIENAMMGIITGLTGNANDSPEGSLR